MEYVDDLVVDNLLDGRKENLKTQRLVRLIG